MLPHVDIIIPVYKNAELTKKCIESVYRWKQDTPHRVIVINDASPEKEIQILLEGLQNENTIVLHNSCNLGFVGTVNRGLLLSEENDVILLNSDTEVTSRWLDKLQACAYQDDRIGTVTPFSNNATICSYPRFCKDNALPVGYTAELLNALFEKNFPCMYQEIPTAVGFCMYIKRKTIMDVGLLDAESFGRGYGEENDFCMRAYKNNWKNVITMDTFVRHIGKASFGDDQTELSQHAKKMLDELHPEYEGLVQRYIAQDSLKKARLTIDFERFVNNQKPAILLVTHNLGGGTERFVSELAEAWISQGYPTFIIKPYGDLISFASGDPNDEFELFFHMQEQYSLLVSFCKALGVSHIHINHFLGFMQPIWSLADDIGIQYDITIHDYYTVCPQISLTEKNDRYCGEQGVIQCTDCLKQKRQSGVTDIVAWRANWEDVLSKARKVWVPSNDVASRFQKYFKQIKFYVLPHPERYTHQRIAAMNSGFPKARLRVAALGALSKIKGAEVLYQCAEDAKRRNLPIDYHLVGYTWRQNRKGLASPLTLTGVYREEESILLLKEYGADIVFFPSQCPETYSYTLTSAILAGCPVMVTNMGAVAERVRRDDIGWIVDVNMSAEEINNEFIRIFSTPLEYSEKVNHVNKVAFQKDFPPAFEYYRGVDLGNVQKYLNYDIGYLLNTCLPKKRVGLKGVIWLLEHKHLPVLRSINRLLSDKSKQRIKYYLKKLGII